jgi:hypothetical protein
MQEEAWRSKGIGSDGKQHAVRGIRGHNNGASTQHWKLLAFGVGARRLDGKPRAGVTKSRPSLFTSTNGSKKMLDPALLIGI